jgi:HSP20 family protein
MARSIERYFRLLPNTKGIRYTERVWYPPADVYLTRDGWIVKIELAGVRPDELEISVDSNILRVAGSRRDSTCTECISYQQLEITYSRFEKLIRFPTNVAGAKVDTVYQDGLLIIRLSEQD